MAKWRLSEDRYFDPDPAQRRIARELYEQVAYLPIVSPHGHLDPRLFAEDAPLGTPTELFIISDHYVFRMLYSQGIPLERLGIPRIDGGPVEEDHRKIWQIFADNFYLFRGTPTGCWLAYQLYEVLGIEEKLTGETAQRIYDQIAEKLSSPDFRPRKLYERFRIEVLCTTDAPTDPLHYHQAIRQSGWKGNIRPTFRPDDVFRILGPEWRKKIEALSQLTGIDIHSYRTFLQALEERRTFFKSMGATAADHDAQTAYTEELSPAEAEAIFQRALQGRATAEDARRFTAHMLMESARMSIEDGLVMQLHVGSVRNHNPFIFERFGPDRGCDIPQVSEFTHNLRPLLNKYGNDPRLTLIVFTLDESTYSRELAPLAGHYPALKIGPPWWFHDSFQGMKRYFEQVMETAGIYNTVGFNDDARNLLSIPARHDLWRRSCANWLAGLVVRGIVDLEDAHDMMLDLSYRLAKKAYKL
ncbi:MAG: glucuronate isomerase [Anaerolineae bacterium]|nr:glucuronate isomerase [Anaerolineae bacterium]MDW8102323.1 glucuronate isomerase [Anaerolineae bacterium]